MRVTLAHLVAVARQGDASLVSESAGYIVLALADLAQRAPRLFLPAEVELEENGDVVSVGGAEADATLVEARIRRLLAWLLSESRVRNLNLERVSERGASAGLAHLVVELEAALVPVNRKAARRTLSRLYREVARCLSRGEVVPATFPEAIPTAPETAQSALVAPSLSAQAPSAPPSHEGEELAPLDLSAVAPRVAPAPRIVEMRAEPPASLNFVEPTPVAGLSVLAPHVAAIEAEPESVPAESWSSGGAETELCNVEVWVEEFERDAQQSELARRVDEALRASEAPEGVGPAGAESASSEAPLSEASGPSVPSGPSEPPSSRPERRPSDVHDLLARYRPQPRSNEGAVLRGLERLAGLAPSPASAEPEAKDDSVRPDPVIEIH
jgi:hypothetical protein